MDRSGINQVARLACIAVAETEMLALTQELTAILHLVGQINTLDTHAVVPLAHPYDETQPWRDDVISEVNQRDAFQAIAPCVIDHLYLVPAVIDDAS